MRKLVIALCALLVLGIGVPTASADTILFDWGFNVNGTTYIPLGPALPGGFNTSLFNFGTGLGTLTFTTTVDGTFSFAAFFDHELSESTNTFFNELGALGAALSTGGWSWEIDEPGYAGGDIYNHFAAGAFDNSIGFPGVPNDVSMGIGHTADYVGLHNVTYTMTLSGTPTAGWWLQHYDLDSNESVYLTMSYDATPVGPASVPEPATLLLFGTGLAGVVRWNRRKK